MGTDRTPYKIVNFSDRRKYLGNLGYAYLDLANSKIVFTGTPTLTAYSFDYISVPTALVAGTSPVIPTRFQDIIPYGMAAENDIMHQSPKAESYMRENQARYDQYLIDLAYWNAQLILN